MGSTGFRGRPRFRGEVGWTSTWFLRGRPRRLGVTGPSGNSWLGIIQLPLRKRFGYSGVIKKFQRSSKLDESKNSPVSVIFLIWHNASVESTRENLRAIDFKPKKGISLRSVSLCQRTELIVTNINQGKRGKEIFSLKKQKNTSKINKMRENPRVLRKTGKNYNFSEVKKHLKFILSLRPLLPYIDIILLYCHILS